MARKNGAIQLKKLGEDSNPRLAELLSEVDCESHAAPARPSGKPAWGRRFNASGKFKMLRDTTQDDK
jgi:hypothetical protein